MTPLFKKLNLKDEKEILVLNAPLSFASELTALKEITIQCNLQDIHDIHFALAFVIQQEELDKLAAAMMAKAPGDALLWFAYPKQTSKKYHCHFNRDTGWEILGKGGFEAVRQVAIDEDWSALRFRRISFIKTLNREEKRSLSAEGKRRANEKQQG